jgi:EAL domain-containing protein (putative c-di-GMP-specific phosphodiesterase class I)
VQPGYSDLVSATLQQCGLAPQRLIIEVTESVLDERNMDRASASLSALHGLGVEIHLDDFGTGYSSLALAPVATRCAQDRQEFCHRHG